MSKYHAYNTVLLPTPSDIEGPFYLAGAEEKPDGVIGRPQDYDQRVDLVVQGQVLSTDGTPLVGVILDIWQADPKGVYDEHGFKLRGKVVTDGKGCYKFRTVIPGDYQIAETPPEFRCAHIHVKVTADGFKPLTTQLYFPDDKYNTTDRWFDPRRVIQHPDGVFDFILEPTKEIQR